jgi:hypothetical protein
MSASFCGYIFWNVARFQAVQCGGKKSGSIAACRDVSARSIQKDRDRSRKFRTINFIPFLIEKTM